MKKRVLAMVLCLFLLAGCGAAAGGTDLMTGVTPAPGPVGGQLSSSGGSDLMEGVLPVGGGAELQPDSPGALAVADFGVRLFRQALEGGGAEPLVSPLSVACALAMTANGASEATLAQMEQVLGADVDTLNAFFRSYLASLPREEKCKLSVANAIWFKDDPTFTVERPFLQTNADYYGAGAYKAPFDQSTVKDINRWVEEHTDGMIDGILDEISAEAVLYLVNALAFDGEWNKIYRESQVQPGTFTALDGTVREVELMYSSEGRYLRTDNASGFLKSYAGHRYAFAALLPDEGVSLADCAAVLTGEGLQQLLAGAEAASVTAGIPKFEKEFSADLGELLADMGMPLAFSGGNFSRMGSSVQGQLVISRVLHKTFIAVDEKGTKAGAATAVEMLPESAPMPQKSYRIVLDRPFLYFLVDLEAGVPLFMGAVTDIPG